MVRMVIHTMEGTLTPLGTATVRIRTTADPSVETKLTRPGTDCARPLFSHLIAITCLFFSISCVIVVAAVVI